MNMSATSLTLFAGAAVVVSTLALLLHRRPPPTDPELPSRLSLLSGASFLCALGALLAALASFLTGEFAAQSDVLGIRAGEVKELLLASEILRFSAPLPALAALAFGLAARGAIRESQGALRGRALYRMAVLLALSVGAVSWAGMSV